MTGNARYRSPHRLPALLLMAALSAALLLAAVLGYPALRRGYLTAHGRSPFPPNRPRGIICCPPPS